MVMGSWEVHVLLLGREALSGKEKLVLYLDGLAGTLS